MSERTSLGERIFSALLLLYPKKVRKAFRSDMLAHYRLLERDPRYRTGFGGKLRLWLFLLSDVVRATSEVTGRPLLRAGAHNAISTTRSTSVVIQSLLTDLRYGLRSALRRPTFFAISVGTMALGVGATTTIFSVVDGVVFKPLPYPDADRIVSIMEEVDFADFPVNFSGPDFVDLEEQNTVFAAVTAVADEGLTLMTDGEPQLVDAAGVTPGFFDVFATYPAIGRAFSTDEDRPGAEGTVILGHGLWQSRWGGDPSVVGQVVSLDERPYTVIGVMPRTFHPPESLSLGETDLWVPLSFVAEEFEDRNSYFVRVAGRLEFGVTIPAAEEAMRVLGASIAETSKETSEGYRFLVTPAKADTVESVGAALFTFLGAVGFFLLIACLNVAHLFLVRASERSKEMALRASLGAGRGRLTRQLVAEGLTLASLGGVLGLGIAYLGVEVFRDMNPLNLPRVAEIGVDLRTVVFAAGLIALSGVSFGALPALRLPKAGLAPALRSEGARASRTKNSGAFRNGLVVAETGLAMVLLVGSGLLIHSFVKLMNVETGFAVENVATMRLNLPPHYEDEGSQTAFHDALVERSRSLPMISSMATTNGLPLGGNTSLRDVTPEGVAIESDEPQYVLVHFNSNDYFETLDIPLLEGRDLSASDRGTDLRVAVVTRSFVDEYWNGESAVGRRLTFSDPERDDPTWIEVVGVAEDTKQLGLKESYLPEVYLPFSQEPRRQIRVVARHSGDFEATAEALRQVVRSIDPRLPIVALEPLEARVQAQLGEPRFYALLLTAFASLGLLLAVAGVYGTVAYSVEQRHHELGVRMALGATRLDILRLVVGKGAMLAGGGVALGLIGAVASTKWLSSFVFEISTTDPMTMTTMATCLGSAALVASYLPARKATRLDPLETLQAE